VFYGSIMVDTGPIAVPAGRLRLLRQPVMFSASYNQSARDWVDEFNLIFSAAGHDNVEMARYLPLYLEGTPLLWYRSLSEDDKKSMETLGKALVGKFAPRNNGDLHLRNLWQRAFLPGEKMLDYVYAKLELCRLADSTMGVEQQIAWIKRGLPNHYLERLRHAKCATIEDLVTELLDLESFSPNVHPISAVTADTEVLKSAIREVLAEQESHSTSDRGTNNSRERTYKSRPKPEVRDDYDSRSGDGSRAKFNGYCWRCGILGHAKVNCRVNLRYLNDEGTCTGSGPGSNNKGYRVTRK